MTQDELYEIIASDEGYRIELTTSTTDMAKFQEAICAFANDMPGSRKKGYLLLGVRNDGEIDGLKVDDTLMKRISAIRSDGNILPLPVMNTEKVVTDKGDVLVVEVTPSFDTPVRYRGRTFIRIGPRRDIATAEEERILAERCAASLPTFDTRPCREAKLEDIDVDTIVSEYLPKAIDSEVLANDKRPLKEQLASLHLFNMQWDCPTYAALIMFGKNPRYYMPGAYIQFVRFKGKTNGGEILNERRFEGCLYTMLPELERFIDNAIVTKRPVPISTLREKDVHNYPYKALRELMMNSCMHRDYQSNMPTRLYQYDSHIEVMNPGGLYGQARPENFPHVNDYRNSVVAEMMKTLNYVNMFNHGINEVQDLLKANGNPEAEFNVSYLTAFSVVVNKPDETILPKFAQVDGRVNINDNEIIISKLFQELFQACPSIAQVSPKQIFAVLDCCNEGKSLAELMEALSASSRRTFVRRIMLPFMEDNLVKQTHPDNPRHPHQKYILTEKGKEWLDKLSEQ